MHEALAALLALRCTRQQRNSIGYAVNDHGLVLAPAQAIDLDAAQWHALFSPDQLLDDLRAAVNLGELARRQFRGIARVAGLLVPSLPGGMPRSLRQLQASAGLLYDVLREHDPEHLLALAEREVLHDSLDLPGLRQVLVRIGAAHVDAAPCIALAPGLSTVGRTPARAVQQRRLAHPRATRGAAARAPPWPMNYRCCLPANR